MAFPTLAPAPPSLDILLYALGQISFVREYRPPSPAPPSTSCQKISVPTCLKLLNLISLLLVTGTKGDVAAITPSPLRFHWSKLREGLPLHSGREALHRHSRWPGFSLARRKRRGQHQISSRVAGYGHSDLPTQDQLPHPTPDKALG